MRLFDFIHSQKDRFWVLIHFGLSSCVCLIIDKLVFSFLAFSLIETVGRGFAIVVAQIFARLVSGHANFFYNNKFVFGQASVSFRKYWGYWGLCLCIVSLSLLLTELLTMLCDAHGWAITFWSIVADVLCFFISFIVQRIVIFTLKGKA